MLISHKIFTEAELKSRYEITLENYCKTVVIEANTMVDMTKKQILPAVSAYASDLAETVSKKLAVAGDIACGYEKGTVKKLSILCDKIAESTDALESALIKVKNAEEIGEEAVFVRDMLLPAMSELRVACDEAETATAETYWPFPTYGDLLFGVR
jgi:glutamine synthetase